MKTHRDAISLLEKNIERELEHLEAYRAILEAKLDASVQEQMYDLIRQSEDAIANMELEKSRWKAQSSTLSIRDMTTQLEDALVACPEELVRSIWESEEKRQGYWVLTSEARMRNFYIISRFGSLLKDLAEETLSPEEIAYIDRIEASARYHYDSWGKEGVSRDSKVSAILACLNKLTESGETLGLVCGYGYKSGRGKRSGEFVMQKPAKERAMFSMNEILPALETESVPPPVRKATRRVEVSPPPQKAVEAEPEDPWMPGPPQQFSALRVGDYFKLDQGDNTLYCKSTPTACRLWSLKHGDKGGEQEAANLLDVDFSELEVSHRFSFTESSPEQYVKVSPTEYDEWIFSRQKRKGEATDISTVAEEGDACVTRLVQRILRRSEIADHMKTFQQQELVVAG